MNIVICAPHHWPIPTPANTGHRVILDLAIALQQLGHDVTMLAPLGTQFEKLLIIQCAHGTGTPDADAAEREALRFYQEQLDAADIIHDWSDLKSFAVAYPDKSVSTVLSGNFNHPRHGRNVVVWSREMQERAYRGASDYEGTEFHQWHSVSRALADAHVVPGGVDTEFWAPGDTGRDIEVLWLGRWHEARGYRLAIDLARANPHLALTMAGEHPDNATNDHQRACANEAHESAKGLHNVRFAWLPKESHREAVRELYQRARCYLFTPLFREPFGLSQAEALACGTPVVACRIGSAPEVIEHGLTGFVVEPAFLAQAIEKVGTIAPERCRMEAVKRFDRSVMARGYVEQYELVRSGNGWG